MRWNGKKRKLTSQETEALKVLAVQQEAAGYASQRYVLDLLARRGLNRDQWRLSDDLTMLVPRQAVKPGQEAVK